MVTDTGHALETVWEAQRRLADVGFVADLMVAGSRVRDTRTGREVDPRDLAVVETVRFEGSSDPADEALLVALATRSGDPVGSLVVPYGASASADQAEVVRHLHRLVVTPGESADHGAHEHGAHDHVAHEHGAHDHVAAVMPTRAAAEAVVEELRDLGLGDEHLGVALHHGDHAVFARDEEADLARDIEEGAVAGAGIGFLAGMALLAVAVPGIGVIGLGGLAALGAASGFTGTVIGGLLGVAAASGEFDFHEDLRGLALGPDEVLVVACGHHHPELVRAALQRHGGRLVPMPVS